MADTEKSQDDIEYEAVRRAAVQLYGKDFVEAADAAFDESCLAHTYQEHQASA